MRPVAPCGRPVRLHLTAGQCGDAPRAAPLREGFEPGQVRHVLADAACDAIRVPGAADAGQSLHQAEPDAEGEEA